MAKDEEERVPKGFSGAWPSPAKRCDSCKSAAAMLFCRADSAFLCVGCDTKVHGANKLAYRHERVWMCEVCEQAPASVTCKADDAALCVSCDADIHSANPLARRHERFPVVPFYEPAASAAKSAGVNLLKPRDDDADDDDAVGAKLEDEVDEVDEDEACQEEAEVASWLLSNPNPKLTETPDLKPGDYFFSDVDPYLELDYGPSVDPRFGLGLQNNNAADSVVPVQNKPVSSRLLISSSDHNCFDSNYSRPKPSYSYTTPSLSHSVSSSSLDVGVVPDGSEMSFGGTAKSGIDVTGGTASSGVPQLSGLDREARVMRYREKRKNRKFEKTIRYASRKAYAETRPRIKGRFAKRTDMEPEVERMYSSAAAFMADNVYGVVPSF